MIGDFVSVDEACAILHCKKSYIYQLIHRKTIPFYKPSGGRVLFDARELEDFIRNGRVATHDELNDRATEILNSKGGRV